MAEKKIIDVVGAAGAQGGGLVRANERKVVRNRRGRNAHASWLRSRATPLLERQEFHGGRTRRKLREIFPKSSRGSAGCSLRRFGHCPSRLKTSALDGPSMSS
jgi:hypothetical protein